VVNEIIVDWYKDLTKSIKADMYDLLTKKERPMSFDKTKPFQVESRYSHESFATLDEALNKAKQNSAKEFVDSPVYQAVRLVKAPIPGNIEVETLS